MNERKSALGTQLPWVSIASVVTENKLPRSLPTSTTGPDRA